VVLRDSKQIGVAFHSFAAVSPKIFFKEYLKEARLTGWLVVRREYKIL